MIRQVSRCSGSSLSEFFFVLSSSSAFLDSVRSVDYRPLRVVKNILGTKSVRVGAFRQ